MYFDELIECNQKSVLDFFFSHLKDEAETFPRISYDEIAYTASIFSHYALTSACSSIDMPLAQNLREVFDNFVLPAYVGNLSDPEILEIGGSQILVLAGFFRRQMARKHNLHTYEDFGRLFFRMAGNNYHDSRRSYTMGRMAENFGDLALCSYNMSNTLRDQRFFLRLD